MTKKICSEKIEDESLEAFTACRLVPLDKQPGLRPIGVGEVLRRICGKVVMYSLREDIIKSCSNIQMCSGQRAGSEAAIHSMREVFESEEAEAAILVDAANAFNSINRQALLHNINIVCPIFSCYVNNCYRTPARLFVIGGTEITSEEGTTQGDPLGMAIYAIGLTPLLDFIQSLILEITMAAFADDITSAGECKMLRIWWDNLIKLGPLFGYHPQPTKSWLIVKEQYLEKATGIFQGTKTYIQITTRGKRHLLLEVKKTEKNTVKS